jgi:hypothetical protein
MRRMCSDRASERRIARSSNLSSPEGVDFGTPQDPSFVPLTGAFAKTAGMIRKRDSGTPARRRGSLS